MDETHKSKNNDNLPLLHVKFELYVVSSPDHTLTDSFRSHTTHAQDNHSNNFTNNRYEDETFENETEIAELHDQCLEMILKMDGLWSRKSFLQGMPPLFNSERLSLWLCQLGLFQRDFQQRLTWLYSQDTAERLRFALNELFKS